MSLSLPCKILFRVNICRGRGEKEAADGGHSSVLAPEAASRAVCAQDPGGQPSPVCHGEHRRCSRVVSVCFDCHRACCCECCVLGGVRPGLLTLLSLSVADEVRRTANRHLRCRPWPGLRWKRGAVESRRDLRPNWFRRERLQFSGYFKSWSQKYIGPIPGGLGGGVVVHVRNMACVLQIELVGQHLIMGWFRCVCLWH